ncbi:MULTISPECIES: 23S rRNA (guanosine(2251)-2'-O)-methyltransferase RlmB [Anaerotruncus]|jgi:23S rRNA (guanosine2251-2'-O)-methyltransferase|uniref:23S rRNA (guanosine(2251)-2'-O)-methyltransferase RlmB n=1 Tax=Anaerotruncus TaxID=244127 RepID=UPI000832028C|nr:MULTISPECIES: 23S rRNA (guanosine(2251)-2'-O)-methyltransferase RlmB [Anaerotruncus]RGX54241.1 23S rRNA (guanosine(2251)-2'-O)-methyltransferase RlmB [Anaerotruncus sp. AF02-27]
MGNSNPKQDLTDDLTVVGRNAVVELLKGGRQVECVYICDDTPARGQPISRIVAMAKDAGVPVKKVDAKKLDNLSNGLSHQGVVARAAAYQYSTLSDIFAKAGDEAPFIIIADAIEDPHNLGAIIRTAEAAGAHGIVIPKRGSVGLTAIVGRTSAGAVEHLPVARVTNLVSAIKELKERGVWVYGADMNGARWETVDLTGPLALVIGSEGFGISRLVRENCDGILSLPMCGKINSLNASVAAGILMYEAVRQRTR